MNSTSRSLARLASAALVSLTCASAQAALVSYTSSGSFAAATSGAVTDTFNDLSFLATPGSPLIRGLGGGTYRASTADGTDLFIGSSSFAPSGEEYLSNLMRDGQPITIGSFTGLPVGAVGGYFFGSNVNPIAATMTVTATEIGGATLTETFDCALTEASCFVGFASSIGIASISFQSNTFFAGLDDLVFANAGTVAAPTTTALVGIAALALLASRRRVRRAQG